MDKIKKFLEKLSQKEKETTKEILSLLETNNVSGLDVKKLKGHSDIFRVRKSDIRIIYRIESGKIKLLAIMRRSEKTYRL